MSADVPLSADDDDEESGGGGGGADAILFGNNTESRKMIMTTHSFAETGADDGERVIP